MPAELRLSIYGHLIPGDLSIVRKKPRDGRFASAPERVALATMQICRQIRLETLPIYYGQNIFPCGLGVSNILPALSNDAIACLRRIEIHGFYQCEHKEGHRWQIVTILIDRWMGTMLEREVDRPSTLAVGFRFRHATPICLTRRDEQAVRLKSLISSAGLLDRSTILTNSTIREMTKEFNSTPSDSWVLRNIDRVMAMLGLQHVGHPGCLVLNG